MDDHENEGNDILTHLAFGKKVLRTTILSSDHLDTYRIFFCFDIKVKFSIVSKTLIKLFITKN